LEITGSALRKLRLEAKLTQKKLAELVGVSQAHIAKIENGKVDPRLSTINRILTVLSQHEGKKCSDLMTKGVIFARPDDNVLKVSEIMVRHGISQVPVIKGNTVVGTITEESIIRRLGSNIEKEKVEDIMDPPLPIIPEDASISVLQSILEQRQGVLVVKGKKVVGIITRSDFLKTLGQWG